MTIERNDVRDLVRSEAVEATFWRESKRARFTVHPAKAGVRTQRDLMLLAQRVAREVGWTLGQKLVAKKVPWKGFDPEAVFYFEASAVPGRGA